MKSQKFNFSVSFITPEITKFLFNEGSDFSLPTIIYHSSKYSYTKFYWIFTNIVFSTSVTLWVKHFFHVNDLLKWLEVLSLYKQVQKKKQQSFSNKATNWRKTLTSWKWFFWELEIFLEFRIQLSKLNLFNWFNPNVRFLKQRMFFDS